LNFVEKPPIKTMEDFSAFVGLSRPTVSKYFNDPQSVRSTTRDKIEAAVKESGFRPNMFAVNLNRRRSNILGVIIPNSTDPFYMALTSRVEVIANQSGFLALVLSSDGNPEMEEWAIETFKSMNVAGAIIAPLGVQSHHDTLQALGNTIPLIYVDSPLDETSAFVGTNNRQSFQLIVDYLCRSGEPPCYLGMPPVNTNATTRQLAYIEAMQQLKMEPKVIAPMTAWPSARLPRPITWASRWDMAPTAICALPVMTITRYRATPARPSPPWRRTTTRSADWRCNCCCTRSAKIPKPKPAFRQANVSCSMPRSC
jgi:DNA-binding LacI/PurR family transcriptional regulator